MRGHQKSSPNLRFLKPNCQQPNCLISPLTSRDDNQKSSRLQQSEISLTAEKTQLSYKYQLPSSRMVTFKDQKTSKPLKQTYIQKTEPNETFDKCKPYMPSHQHSCILTYYLDDYINIFNRKKTAEAIFYRPITSHIKKQNLENPQSPRKLQQETTNVYYLSELIKSYESKENYFTKLFKDHLSASYSALKQCGTGRIIYKPKFITLPKDPKGNYNEQLDSKKYTILFDLDETLIHCTLDLKLPADKKLTIKMSQDEFLQVGVNFRPGLQMMLELLSPNFEIIVFTASHGQYAKKIVELIDPKRIISKVLSREHCCFSDLGQYVKDISIIKNRSLAKIVLVDNSASSYYYQLDNGIPIVPFFDNKLDKQLYTLTKYLNGMIGYDDVREYNKKYLKNHIMTKLNTEEEVLEVYKKHHQNLCTT